MHNKLGLALISLIILSILGCSGLPNLTSSTPPKQKPSAHKDIIKEEFTVPYPITTVYKKWSVFKDAKASKTVRPTGYWSPDSYGPFGQESYDMGNSIFRAYYSDGTHFTYCPEECNISIGLVSIDDNTTQVKVRYYNVRGDATPFAEEMRRGMQYFLEKQ